MPSVNKIPPGKYYIPAYIPLRNYKIRSDLFLFVYIWKFRQFLLPRWLVLPESEHALNFLIRNVEMRGGMWYNLPMEKRRDDAFGCENVCFSEKGLRFRPDLLYYMPQ